MANDYYGNITLRLLIHKSKEIGYELNYVPIYFTAVACNCFQYSRIIILFGVVNKLATYLSR